MPDAGGMETRATPRLECPRAAQVAAESGAALAEVYRLLRQVAARGKINGAAGQEEAASGQEAAEGEAQRDAAAQAPTPRV